jgi:hypothetical protein
MTLALVARRTLLLAVAVGLVAPAHAQLTFQLEGTGPAKGLMLHQGVHDHAARRLE